MSIKIYTGARIKTEYLEEALEYYRSLFMSRALEIFQRMRSAVSDGAVENRCAEIPGEHNETFKDTVREWLVFDLLRERELFDSQFECGASLWIRDYTYIVPYGGYQFINLLDVSKYPKHLEDYRYWNNTDIPDNVNDKEWNARLKNWEFTFDSPYALEYKILSYDGDWINKFRS